MHDSPVKRIPVNRQSIEFIKNQGQWEPSIKFQSTLPSGNLYIESGKLTFMFYDQDDIERIHTLRHNKKAVYTEADLLIDAHQFQVLFPGSNEKTTYSGKNIKSNYVNYFLGNDPGNWASNVPVYREAYASDLWPGIDYRIYSNDLDIKYDFVVDPGANPDLIKMDFEHLESIYLKHGNLYLTTSVNELIDMKPVAFQAGKSGYEVIECDYVLKGNSVSFFFPEGYDKSKQLIIDPRLIFSSYSGASQDNWGFTATFDEAGNLYGGGIAFTHATRTYPTTMGAFQINQAGGGGDIAITKFNSDGTSLVYSTYLGGSGNEIPHSLVVNSNNELIVLGTTSSTNYPVTSGAFDGTYNIIGNASRQIASLTFVGSDIVLTKFSANGTSLVGSTYIGGTSFDGFNYNNLEFNYGDDVRGEVIVDNSGFIYVASTTTSIDFPVTNSSAHAGGVQDAVVFKMNPNLTSLVWSTYIGGSGNDAAYSVQLNNSGLVYIAGGTASINFPTTLNTINPLPKGGIDGFVSSINNSNGSINASTRLGTSQYDQAYFVQLDDSGNVYVAGQTEGLYPVLPSSVYRNPNSGQFIHKLTPALDSTIFSTVIGTGGSTVDVDISLSAFLVNQCDHIYLSGWGGDINSTFNNANASTTTGLPVTPGAYKTTTDGNDFYLIVLSEDADSLLYATFFGGTSGFLRGEHVDGGTSRFDKRGIVYQAVCAGCGASNSFPTSPSNVWSTTNPSYNCNLGVIKFDLSQLSSDINLAALTKVCIPGTVNFINNSSGGNTFYWDFGDGDTSTLFQPSHTYIDTGEFQVMLVVSDSLSCILRDTAFITIKGEGPPVADIDSVSVHCPGDSIYLLAKGGSSYQWIPSSNLSNDTIANPMAILTSTATYIVVVGDSCGSDTNNLIAYDTASVTIPIAIDNATISPEDTICKGASIQLMASGGTQYLWNPPLYLNNPNVPNPLSTPDQDITYTVKIWDQYNCLWTRAVRLHVEDPDNPDINGHNDTIICKGDTIEIYTSGGATYDWSPGKYTLDSTVGSTKVFPPNTTSFKVRISSKCFVTTDTILVEVSEFKTIAMPDTMACEEVPIILKASPGERFYWEPKEFLDSGTSNKASINENTLFIVTAYDSLNCTSVDSVYVELKDPPFVSAGNDQVINRPLTELEGKGNGKFDWEPKEYLDCPECPNSGVEIPRGSYLFTLILTDIYGCINTDDVLITRLNNELFVPNSFTPNSDQINDVFLPNGFELTNYQLIIYNRWGEIIFLSTDLETGWDGTYEGKESENGVYVWEIVFTQNGVEETRRGTVSLVR